MKQLFFLLFITASFASCNNDKKPEAATGSPATAATPATDKPAATTALGCSSFLWFKEGTTLEYNLTDSTGKSTSVTTTHINKVHTDGGVMIADFTTSYNKGKDINATYRCEGDKLFMDMKSFFDNNFAGLRKAGLELDMNDAYISFPWNMKPGDNLDAADFVVKAKKAGKEFMTLTSSVKDRKVEGTEKVTTPAGSWDCLKLTEVRTTTTEMMGKKIMGLDTKSVEWFTPGAGLVKMEMYDAKGNLQSRSELVSIK